MRRLEVLLVIFLFPRLICAADLSFFGGWTGTGSLSEASQSIGLEDFTVFGVRYEKGFTSVFGFENTVAYTTNSLVRTGEENRRGLVYTGNLVINIPAPHFAPFFTAGLGVLHKFGKGFPNVGSTLATNYGLGVKVPKIIGPAGLRFEYRRFTLHDVLEGSVKMNEVSGGVFFRF